MYRYRRHQQKHENSKNSTFLCRLCGDKYLKETVYRDKIQQQDQLYVSMDKNRWNKLEF